eukprot:1641075-Prymnesium_polylepis.1
MAAIAGAMESVQGWAAKLPWLKVTSAVYAVRATESKLGDARLARLRQKNRDEERLMLARALSASIADARARSEAMTRSAPNVRLACAGSSEEAGQPVDCDWSERCLINGCHKQLLLCHGQKPVGSSTAGCAASGHLICYPCLNRWFDAQRVLREGAGLQPLYRCECPICRTALQAVRNISGNGASYAMGLRKLEATWECMDD